MLFLLHQAVVFVVFTTLCMLELWQLQTWKYPLPFLGAHLWWLLQSLQIHHCMLLHVWIMQWNIWILEHWALEKYCCWGSSHPLLFPFWRKKAIKANAINIFFTHGAYFDWWIKHGNCGHRISEHIIGDGACLKLWDWKSWQLHYGVNMEVDEVHGDYFFTLLYMLHILDLCCIFK